MSKYPYDEIWLQVSSDGVGWQGETWCVDKINDDDKKYVREDWLTDLQDQRTALMKAVKSLLDNNPAAFARRYAPGVVIFEINERWIDGLITALEAQETDNEAS